MKLSRSFKASSEKFREYLRYSDGELPSLESIFPTGKTISSDCIDFHRDLCKTMIDDGHKFIGIKILPPSYEGIQCFGEGAFIFTPLFSCHMGKSTFDITKYRVQYIESSLCITCSSAVQNAETNVFPKGSLCSVAVEVIGTRFPFYPPSLSALSCDLGGLIGFVKGSDNSIQNIGEENLINHHYAFTRNGEPVQVGCGKLFCGGSFLSHVKDAMKYAEQLNMTLEGDHIIMCSGTSPRVPAQRGTYIANWGRFGSISCTLK